MRLIIFCRLLGMVLCGNAVTVYFASDSIRLAVFTTLALWLVLQVAYFGSVLFLIWRSSGVRGEQTAELFGRSQKARFRPPDNDDVRNERSDLRQRNQMIGIALLLP
ncbi:exopolysaccharide production repressor protein [Mesorhizobium ciceri]|uniref:exopolysaccharide production repressor protein n=1 Tax=Mesorhizobium TaxID=68287 RepID=UPI0007A943D7|nr:exopolysaccharide production repressor protein [Mesorhizobium ciceri]AMX98891.1 exopolysaccharide repressor protein [Mesorhizobium ciceri biovar biserrulae]